MERRVGRFCKSSTRAQTNVAAAASAYMAVAHHTTECALTVGVTWLRSSDNGVRDVDIACADL